MNNTAAFKAITPLVNSYVQRESSAEAVMDLIAAILTENRSVRPATNGRELKKDDPAGFRVTDPEGGTHEYPNARAAQADRDYLRLLDENNDAIAIFRRWEHVERITK